MRVTRLALVVFSATFAFSNCSKSSQTYIDVTVEHPAALGSTCVKVSASGGGLMKETSPIAVSGEASLKVAIYRDNLPETVSLKATGFSDADCTKPMIPAEESGAVMAGFANPPSQITLRMSKAMGVDQDGDGFSPPTDCDDSDATIKPGATERCDDRLDNDCNGAIDCADTTCDLKVCGSGALCMASACVETNCGDKIDGDRDGLSDCADSDCAGKICTASGNAGATCTSGTCVEQACTNSIDDDQDMNVDCRDTDCTGASCGTGGMCVAPDGGTPGRCIEPNETVCNDGADNDGDNLIDCADSDCNTRACNDNDACTTGETCAAGACNGGTATVCNMPPNSCFLTSGACNPSTGTCLYGTLPATTACDDSDPCTEPDQCDGDGGCRSSPKICPPPPTTCFGAGSC